MPSYANSFTPLGSVLCEVAGDGEVLHKMEFSDLNFNPIISRRVPRERRSSSKIQDLFCH